MQKKEFKTICSEVKLGEKHTVEHLVTHKQGNIVACKGRSFEVEPEGKTDHQAWDYGNCRES